MAGFLLNRAARRQDKHATREGRDVPMNQGSSKWPYFGRIARNIIRGLAAIGLLGASWAYADTTDQLLDQLKAKGILTRTEYKKLKARHASEIAARKEKSPYA